MQKGVGRPIGDLASDPIQMAPLKTKLIFHILAAVVDIFTTFYDLFVIPSERHGVIGKFKFLTVWCIVLQSIYFSITVIEDVTEKIPTPVNPSQRSTLRKLRDSFHSTIAFPLSVFVAVTFWGLYAIDRELVFPKRFDAIFPFWLNHLLHTSILPLMLIDKVVSCHVYPKRLYGMACTCIMSLTYLIGILIVAYVENFWVYPILQHMSFYTRFLFILICMAFVSSLYILGEYLTKCIWGSQMTSIDSQKILSKSSKRRDKYDAQHHF